MLLFFNVYASVLVSAALVKGEYQCFSIGEVLAFIFKEQFVSNYLKIRAIGLASLMVSASCVSTAFAEEEEWDFSVAPMYLWAKNIEGFAAIGGSAAPLDLDFKDDILDNLDGAFAIHLEAKKGDLTLYGEYNYAKLNPTTTLTAGPVELLGEVKFRDTMWEAGALWTFANSGSSTWELLGAVRYADQDMDVKITSEIGSNITPRPLRSSVGDDWWQGVAGLRYVLAVTDRWSWRFRGDYGYGDSDNSSVHAIGLLNYQFQGWGSFFFGYRYLQTDFDNGKNGLDGYAFDGDQQGPVLGLNFHL